MKKPPPKPLFSLRADFEASVANVCNECMMLLTALDTVLEHDKNISPAVRASLAERSAKLRAALMSEYP